MIALIRILGGKNAGIPVWRRIISQRFPVHRDDVKVRKQIGQQYRRAYFSNRHAGTDNRLAPMTPAIDNMRRGVISARPQCGRLLTIAPS
ncbi:hypothetical protein KCP74_11500 [Salmonella enterica subsp. enterica]|nr:hypothetical protein KCP74_11500 [Salmonella enterica subsp. enterica]